MSQRASANQGRDEVIRKATRNAMHFPGCHGNPTFLHSAAFVCVLHVCTRSSHARHVRARELSWYEPANKQGFKLNMDPGISGETLDPM